MTEEMISAYILINMERGYSEKAVKQMSKIENVAKVSVISGDYDIVLRIQVDNLSNLSKVTNEIQSVSGVKNTDTHIIEKEIVE